MTGNPPIDTLTTASLRADQVWYVAAPLSPNTEEIASAERSVSTLPTHTIGIRRNIERAKHWLAWLRRRFPAITFIAPWIAAIESGADDTDTEQRTLGLRDDCRVVRRCDGIVLCGGRISSGMQQESLAAANIVDLTGLGSEPPR